MTYPDHLPFLSKAVGHVPVEAGKNYHVIPEIERPDISLEQVALPDNWSTGATDFQRATLTAHNSLIGLTFASSQYPGYTDLYYFAMLPITGDNDRGMPSHEFIIGSGDGEGRLPGAVLQTNWLDKEPQNLDLLAAVDNQPQTTLPANAIKLSRSYYVELQPNHNQQYLQLSIAQQNDASQIEANVAIHVLGSGANAGQLYGVISTEGGQDCYLFLKDPDVMLVALIVPKVATDPTTGQYTFTFEIGDPQKDGVVKVRQI